MTCRCASRISPASESGGGQGIPWAGFPAAPRKPRLRTRRRQTLLDDREPNVLTTMTSYTTQRDLTQSRGRGPLAAVGDGTILKALHTAARTDDEAISVQGTPAAATLMTRAPSAFAGLHCLGTRFGWRPRGR
jgi:hypothetical protein